MAKSEFPEQMQTIELTNELLLCPFCGGKPYPPQPYGNFARGADGNRIDKGTFIQCQNCGANIFRSPNAKDQLILAWNRRVKTL